MSMYLSIDGTPPQDLASNRGWGDFCRWAEQLEDADAISHLVHHGWTEDCDELKAELGQAKGMADESILPIIATIEAVCGTDNVLTITDGLTSEDDENR